MLVPKINKFTWLNLTTFICGSLIYLNIPFGDGKYWMVLLVSIYLIFLGLGVAFINLNFFLVAISSCKGENKQVCLTFDDGPDPKMTPLILNLLSKMKVKAVFFCIGKKVQAYPELAKQIVEEGHVMANHTFHHHWASNFLFGKSLDQEILKAQNTIKNIAGFTPIYFRPPMGLTNPHLKSSLQRLKLTLVGWDVRTLDRKVKQVEPFVKKNLRKVKDGSILLFHDGNGSPKLVQMLQEILMELKKQDYTFVTLENKDKIK